MILFDTSDDKARNSAKDPIKFWIYNGLDSTLTAEIHAKIHPQLREKPCIIDGEEEPRYFEEEIYAFSRTMQAPVAEMMKIGLRIDGYACGTLINSLMKEKNKLEGRLKRLLFEGLELSTDEHPWLKEFNPNSVAPPTINQPGGGHVQQLLYGILGMPVVEGDSGKPSVDREALEKLEKYPPAQPFCAILIALRDITKNLSDLRASTSADGRIRTSLSVAGTNTGRMSSYAATDGTGRNMQNADPMLRHIYCADPGRKFAYIDLEQAEARMVGAIIWSLFGDPTYLDACESGDTHTSVAMMTWPHLKSREDAEQLYYRNFSYRFMCKRTGFGSNYNGAPRGLSRETSIPIKLIEDFQDKYFTAFPGIRRWHKWVAQQLVAQGFLVSLMGRKRWFMGRADDDATLREAIAYDPQSSIADLLNRGLFRLWYLSKTQPELYPIKLHLQVHDAVLLSYPENIDEQDVLPRLVKALETPITLRHKDQRRALIIPAEAKIGWNWGDKTGANIDGLIKWKADRRDGRRRINDPSRAVLDAA